MFRGITKRWMLNTLSVILTIIILIVVTLICSKAELSKGSPLPATS